MKACVKATGKIVEVKYSRQMGPDAVYRDLVTGEHYMDFELSFLPEDGTPDYWTRLEHQYAGMAMQAMLTSPELMQVVTSAKELLTNDYAKRVAVVADRYAHALVEKYKKEEK